MLHFVPPPTTGRRFQSALPPLTPDAYLVLRRKDAGLSVAELARRLDHGNTVVGEELIRMLESPGTKARYRNTIEAFAAVMPLDVDVYQQLCDTPADSHPRICRGCGCSEWHACVSADGAHTCAWSGPASCTRCTDTPNVPVHQ